MQNRAQHIMQSIRAVRANTLRNRITDNTYYQSSTTFIQKRPLASFFVALVILFGVIILGSILGRTSNKAETTQAITKPVSTYSIGATPKVSMQAKVEKSGVVKIIAQTSGVVQKISVNPGDKVKKGTQLLQLSSNYQGGNAPALQTALAQTQYKNVLDTYDAQKDLIKKQRDITNKSAENTNSLRDISKQSVDETKSLLDLNNNILSTINTNLQNLENNNVNGVNDTAILQTKQAKSQVQAGVNQLQSAVRNLDYTTNTDKPISQLTDLQKDITLKQLDLQEKALDLNKKVSGLQVSLAAVGESMMSPSSPFAGTVDRILVNEGQLVTPGTLLAIVTCPQKEVKLYAGVSREIAQSVSRLNPSIVHIQNKSLSILPLYVSDEATDGNLYTVSYALPEEYNQTVTDAEYVTVDIPLGYVTGEETATPYIPIDAVFQTQDEAYVNIAQNEQAVSRKLVIGNVYGKYVEVTSGLSSGDKVILDRNILAGDRVKIN